MDVQLFTPQPGFEESYRNYIAELGNEERYPFPMDFDHSDFEVLLDNLDRLSAGTGLPPGFVPATTYWLIRESELVGVSNLRHYLNEQLRISGGHIGLGIRPSCRGHGLGNLLLQKTVQKAHELGISEVHVHCHKSNVPSARMILSNGGVLDSEVMDEGTVIQRYIIHAT